MAVERERLSRPTSLLLEGPTPEKEALKFDVQLDGAPPEVEQLVNNIKQVSEGFLYHWKTFPIVLPSSNFSGLGNHLSDIIVAPACDDAEALLDGSGEPQLLSAKQLASIREKGEFEVPSRLFPGQTQVWQMASWIQKGRERIKDDMYWQIAEAVSLVIVVARDRLLSEEPVSLVGGVKAFFGGLHKLLDLLVGMPDLEARDLDKKIREERSRYLIAELVCKPDQQEELCRLATWVSRALRRAIDEKRWSREWARLAPPPPMTYTTPGGIEIDVRLHGRALRMRVAPRLAELMERHSRGWWLQWRASTARALRAQGAPDHYIHEEIRESGMREYVRRVCADIAACPDLHHVQGLLVAQIQAHAIIESAEASVKKKVLSCIASAELQVRAGHAVLARAGRWRRRQLAQHAQHAALTYKWTAMEEAAAALQAANLHQHKYFLMRDLAFLRDREPLLIKELSAAKIPTREFTFTRLAADTPQRAATTDTRYAGWRLLNLYHRWRCWWWNCMCVLGVGVMWGSPVGARALLYRRPFKHHSLTQMKGTVYPRQSSETQTLCSMVVALWRLVTNRNTRFEERPDTGILGKGINRFGHRVYNYGIIGGLGTLALLLFFPPISIVVCLTSLFGVITAVFWSFAAAVGVYLMCGLVYDIDSCGPVWERVLVLFRVLVYDILTLGILQPIVALIAAVIVLPLCCGLMCVGAVSFWWVRSSWEWLCLRWLRGARVPTADSALCRRTPMPLTYTLTAPQAVAAICAKCELEQLNVYQSKIEAAINAPLRDYNQFADACFAPFSLAIAKNGPYKQLEKECAELVASLREKVAASKQELALSLPQNVKERVRMTEEDLRLSIEVSCVECARILPCVEAAWWEARGLARADWRAAAAAALQEMFSSEILVPLSGGEACVPLCGGGGGGGAAWRRRCADRSVPPDLTHDTPEWYMCGVAPRAPAPRLPAAAAAPAAALPPPHHTAIHVYNRDAESPIPIESEICADILKSLEDAPDTEDRRTASRDLLLDAGSLASSDCTLDDDDDRPPPQVESICRAVAGGRCRWTLGGRGADLASPEDCDLPPPTSV